MSDVRIGCRNTQAAATQLSTEVAYVNPVLEWSVVHCDVLEKFAESVSLIGSPRTTDQFGDDNRRKNDGAV